MHGPARPKVQAALSIPVRYTRGAQLLFSYGLVEVASFRLFCGLFLHFCLKQFKRFLTGQLGRTVSGYDTPHGLRTFLKDQACVRPRVPGVKCLRAPAQG